MDHVKAVDNLTLPVVDGKTTVILGESGCGKTTLLKSILGLVSHVEGNIQTQTQSCSIKKFGQKSPLRNKTQIIFQDPYSSLNPKLQIQDILLDGMKQHHIKNSLSERIHKIKHLLEMVELHKDILNRYPHEFSGGQRQRICIARVLCLEPKFIICDEITSSLDVSIQAVIINLLQKLQIQMNLTYLFITHNIKLASYLADYIAIMNHGKIIEYNSNQNIINHPKEDYTKILLQDICE